MSAVASTIHNKGWVFRPLSLSDYGIDGEIEIRDIREQMTGALLRVQVKGRFSESVKRRKSLSVKTSTVRYWLVSPVPVFILIVTGSNDGNEITSISIRDYLFEQRQLDSVKATNKKRFTFNLQYAVPFEEAAEYMEELATSHQNALLDLQNYSLYNPEAQIWSYYRLIYHYDCNIDLMLTHMRKEASDERLVYDYGGAAQMKKAMSENPQIIDEYRWLVEETLKDTGALEVKEKPEYVKHLFPQDAS